MRGSTARTLNPIYQKFWGHPNSDKPVKLTNVQPSLVDSRAREFVLKRHNQIGTNLMSQNFHKDPANRAAANSKKFEPTLQHSWRNLAPTHRANIDSNLLNRYINLNIAAWKINDHPLYPLIFSMKYYSPIAHFLFSD